MFASSNIKSGTVASSEPTGEMPALQNNDLEILLGLWQVHR